MPVARFQMPDGRIARFEVPEGTTPEKAQELISKVMSGSGNEKLNREMSVPGKLNQVRERGTIVPSEEYIANSIRKVPGSIAGLAQMAASGINPGMGLQLRNQGINAGKYVDELMGAREGLDTESMGAKLTGKAIEYTGGGLPFSKMGRTADYLASAVGAAGGDVLGEGVGGESGRVAGSLVGGVLGPSLEKKLELGKMVAGKGAQLVKGLWANKNMSYDEALGSAKAAAADMKAKYGDDAMANLKTELEARGSVNAARDMQNILMSDPKSVDKIEAINGYLDAIEEATGKRPNISLAEAIQNPELLDEAAMMIGSRPENMRKAFKDASTNKEIVGGAVRSVGGGADRDSIIAGLRSVLDDDAAKITTGMADDAGKKVGVLGGISGVKDSTQAGGALRTLVDTERVGVQKVFNDQFSTFSKKAKGARFDPEQLVAYIKKIEKDVKARLDPTNHPRIFSRIDDLIAGKNKPTADSGIILPPAIAAERAAAAAKIKPISMEEAWGMLQELGDDLSHLSTQVNPARDVLRKLSTAQDVLLGKVMNIGAIDDSSRALSKELAGLRKSYRNNYIERFGIGTNLKLRQIATSGEKSLFDSDVGTRYLSKPEHMMRLQKAVGDDPNAMKLIDDLAVYEYAKRTMQDVSDTSSKFSRKAHDTFMKGPMGETLRKTRPELYEKLRKTGLDADSYQSALESKAKELKELTSSTLSKQVKVGDVDSVIDDALKLPDNMDKLLVKLDSKGKAELKNAIIDRMSGPEGHDPDLMIKFLSKNSESLAKIMTPKELKTLTGSAQILKAMLDPSKVSHSKEIWNEGSIKRFLRENGLPATQLFAASRAIGRHAGSVDWFAYVFGVQAAAAMTKNAAIRKSKELGDEIMKNPKAREEFILKYLGQKGNIPMPTGATAHLKRLAKAFIPSVEDIGRGTGVSLSVEKGDDRPVTMKSIAQ